MRLVVDLPEAWNKQVFGTRVRADIEPGVEIEIAPIAELPEDLTAWAQGLPQRDRTGGVERVEVTRRTEAKTDLGWPMGIHESRGMNASGEPIQARIHVNFIFVEHCSMIAIRATDPARLDALRDQLLAVVRTTRPEWGQPPGSSLEDLLAT